MIYLTTRGGHSQPNVLMMEKIKILSFLFLISTAKHLFVNIRGYACSEAVLLLLCTGIVHSKLFCADHTVQVTRSLSSQQQLEAIEKVTNVKTDVRSVIGKSKTCV